MDVACAFCKKIEKIGGRSNISLAHIVDSHPVPSLRILSTELGYSNVLPPPLSKLAKTHLTLWLAQEREVALLSSDYNGVGAKD